MLFALYHLVVHARPMSSRPRSHLMADAVLDAVLFSVALLALTGHL